jgi:hypothetical protein
MANCLRVALVDGKYISLISLPIVCKNSGVMFSRFGEELQYEYPDQTA